MPDRRQHRGAHPQDRQLFGLEQQPRLRSATFELSWLLTRGYTVTSSLKLVGDRYDLDARQRVAVARCACGDDEFQRRRRHEVQGADLRHQELWIDGYNVLTSLEAALSGGVILSARDGTYRDMASMHGSYRKVAETLPAIDLLGDVVAQYDVAACHWYLDQPVSNSGRLKTVLQEAAARHGWNWRVELVADPDAVLIGTDEIVASADSRILDQTARWFNLARVLIEQRVPDAWIVDLGF